MSGRKQRKNQKLGSSRRNRNRDAKEKECDDGFPQTGDEELEIEQQVFRMASEKQAADANLLPQSGQAAPTCQQTSASELHPHSQSQDLLAQAEAASKKRKMGSTRKSNRGFKGGGIPEEEPEGRLEVSEGFSEEHGVTKEASFKGERSTEDYYKQSLSVSSSSQSINPESSTLPSEHWTFSSTKHEDLDECDQFKGTAFIEESEGHVATTTESSRPPHETEDYCQMETLANMSGQKKRTVSGDRPLEEERITIPEYDFEDVHVSQDNQMASDNSVNTAHDQSTLNPMGAGEQERESTVSSHGWSVEAEGEDTEVRSTYFIHEHEQEYSNLSEEGLNSSRVGTEGAQDGTVKEDISDHCLEHRNETVKLTMSCTQEFIISEYKEGKEENEDVHMLGDRKGVEDVREASVIMQTVDPDKSMTLFPKKEERGASSDQHLSYEIDLPRDSSASEIRHHSDALYDLSDARLLTGESGIGENRVQTEQAVKEQSKEEEEEEEEEEDRARWTEEEEAKNDQANFLELAREKNVIPFAALHEVETDAMDISSQTCSSPHENSGECSSELDMQSKDLHSGSNQLTDGKICQDSRLYEKDPCQSNDSTVDKGRGIDTAENRNQEFVGEIKPPEKVCDALSVGGVDNKSYAVVCDESVELTNRNILKDSSTEDRMLLGPDSLADGNQVSTERVLATDHLMKQAEDIELSFLEQLQRKDACIEEDFQIDIRYREDDVIKEQTSQAHSNAPKNTTTSHLSEEQPKEVDFVDATAAIVTNSDLMGVLHTEVECLVTGDSSFSQAGENPIHPDSNKYSQITKLDSSYNTFNEKHDKSMEVVIKKDVETEGTMFLDDKTTYFVCNENEKTDYGVPDEEDKSLEKNKMQCSGIDMAPADYLDLADHQIDTEVQNNSGEVVEAIVQQNESQENVETELYAQSQTMKKRKFGSTRRPQGGHRPDIDVDERKSIDVGATEGLEHDHQDTCSKEATQQAATSDLLAEPQSAVSEVSLDIIDLPSKKETIESEEEKRERNMIDAPLVIMSNASVHQIDNVILEENSKSEDRREVIEHRKSAVEDDRRDDSNEPSIITQLQNISTCYDSSQEASMVIKDHDLETIDNGSPSQVYASPTGGTVELISKTQGSLDMPVNTENEAESDRMHSNHSISVDHLNEPTNRESELESMCSFTQESKITHENVITVHSEPNTSDETQRREQFHAVDQKDTIEDAKAKEDTRDEKDNEDRNEDVHRIEIYNPPSRKNEVIEEGNEETTEEINFAPTEDSTTEDFTAEHLEKYMDPGLSCETTELVLTTNIQPPTVTEHSDSKEEDGNSQENAEISNTEPQAQSQSKKKKKFGSTRRPQGGHRSDNKGEERERKDVEATEGIERDQEERCSKETSHQASFTGLLSEPLSAVSGVSLGILDSSLEKVMTDLNHETGLTDTVAYHNSNEVSKVEELVEITEEHGKSVADDERENKSTSSYKQDMPPVITNIENDTSTYHTSPQKATAIVEEHGEESTENGMKDVEATEGTENDEEERYSKETNHQAASTDVLSEKPRAVGEVSSGILGPLLEKETIESKYETSHIRLTDIVLQNTDNEVHKKEDLVAIIEHGQSIVDDEIDDESTFSDKQKIEPVITEMQDNISTYHDSSQEASMMVLDCGMESTDNGSPSHVHASPRSGTIELISEINDSMEISVNTENTPEVTSDQMTELPWDHNKSEDYLYQLKYKESEPEHTETTCSFIHTHESKNPQGNVITENSELNTSGKRRKMGSTRKSPKERLHGGGVKESMEEKNEKEEKGGEKDDEDSYREEKELHVTERTITSSRKNEVTEEESEEIKEELKASPAVHSTTEEFIEVHSEQLTDSVFSSTSELGLTTNIQPSPVTELSDSKQEDGNSTENAEMKNAELHTQSQSKKKKKFGSTRRPQGGNRPDNEEEDRRWKDLESTEGIEHDEEERDSKETSHQAATSDLSSEPPSAVVEVSLGILEPLLEEEFTESYEETGKHEIVDTSHVILTDSFVHHTGNEVSKAEEPEVLLEEDGRTAVEGVRGDESTSSNKHQVPPVITNIQNATYADHDSSQEANMIVESRGTESTDNENPSQIYSSPTCGTVEPISEDADSLDVRMKTESTYDIISDQIRELPSDQIISVDQPDQPSNRDSELEQVEIVSDQIRQLPSDQGISVDQPDQQSNRLSELEHVESTCSLIHIQESKNSQGNVITENSELNTSGKRRKMGSTRKSHKERLHGGGVKESMEEKNEKEEKGGEKDDEDSYREEKELHVTERTITSSRKNEVTEVESEEIKEELKASPAVHSTTEEFIEVHSEQFTDSVLSSTTSELGLTTNIQPSPVAELSDSKQEDGNSTENAEMKNAELHTQSQSKKKKKFGSTRRPQGGNRPDNEEENRRWKDLESTEGIEHDEEERGSKETNHQAATSDLSSEPPSAVTEMSLGILEPLLEEEFTESNEETGKHEIVDTSHVILMDSVIHHIDNEVSKAEDPEVLIEEDGRTAVEGVRGDESTSSNKHQVPPVITNIHNATYADHDSSQEANMIVEGRGTESTDNESPSQIYSSPTCGTLELISEDQHSLDVRMNTESTYEILSDQIRQLPSEQSISVDQPDEPSNRDSEIEQVEIVSDQIRQLPSDQGISVDQPDQQSNRLSELEHVESTCSLIHIQESKNPQGNVITENSELNTSGKRRKMGSTRKSHKERLHGGGVKESMEEKNEKEEKGGEKDDEDSYREEKELHVTERTVTPSRTNEVTEVESEEIKEELKASPAVHSTTEEFIEVHSEQLTDSVLSSTTSELGLTTNIQPSPVAELSDSKQEDGNSTENTEMKNAELHTQSQSKKKKKFGSTRRPQGGNRPDNEEEGRRWKDLESTEGIEHDEEERCSKETSHQAASSDLSSEPPSAVVEVSLGIFETLLEEEFIESNEETGKHEIVNTPHVILTDSVVHHTGNEVSKAEEPEVLLEEDGRTAVEGVRGDELEQVESSCSLIHIQESKNPQGNVITENSELNTSGKRRKMGSTRKSHREQLHGGGLKESMEEKNEKEEKGGEKDDEDSYREETELHVTERTITSSRKNEVTEEESEEIKEELKASPAVHSTTEDFIEVHSEQLTDSVLSTTTSELGLTTNIQPSPVTELSDSKQEDGNSTENAEMKNADVHTQSQSKKKKKFGSTRRPQLGKKPDNEEEDRRWKDLKSTEGIEHEEEERCSKETNHQAATSLSAGTELSLGILIEEMKEKESTKEQTIAKSTPVNEEGNSEVERLIPAIHTEPSHRSIELSESTSTTQPQVEQLDNKKRKMGSTRKTLNRGNGKKAWEKTTLAMDLNADEDIAKEETNPTTKEDTVLYDNAFGQSAIAETLGREDKLQIHHEHDQSEGSLLSEIECELKKSCQSPLNTTAFGILDSSLNNPLKTGNTQQNILEVPEPMAAQGKDSLELPQSQSSRTNTEPSSPGRRRKMGSTRKTARNNRTEELRDETRDTEQERENLELGKNSEVEREAEDAKGSVDVTTEVQVASQVDQNDKEHPMPGGRRKFGSSRKAKGVFEPNQKETEEVQVLADELTICDPYFTSEPENTFNSLSASDQENTKASPGTEQVEQSVVNEADVSTGTGLVSFDDLRKSALYNGSTGRREIIDFDRWNEQIPEFGVAVYNVVMVGNCNVGKTSFIRRFQSGFFSPEYSSTIGVDTFVQTITLGNRTVKLHIWDTAGQERYHSITTQVFHKAQGLLLMYDITSSESFCAVRNWISQIQERAPTDVIMMLLGNKKDCEGRTVQPKEGEGLSRDYNIHFMECSAATGENVSESLKCLAWFLVKQNVRREEEQAILQPKQPQKKSGCC